MRHLLIIGAGKSATTLINYFLDHARDLECMVTVAERDVSLAAGKIQQHPNARAVSFDVFDVELLSRLIGENDLIISMLPAALHIHVARKCAEMKKHFLTASYLKEDIKALHGQFASAGKLAIMEIGLDPGIDHMSAMQVLDQLKDEGHQLTGFETFTGGLIAEESVHDNPWKYKFTWNPRNVVLAGQGTCKFIQEGRFKYIPYQKVFRRTEAIYIPEHGYFEGYANRDSLAYLDVYNLRGIKTLYRGTLRRPGYCAAWDVFVQLGATDDSYEMEHVSEMTHRQFMNSFLSYNPKDSVELKLAHYLNLDLHNGIMFKLRWLGMFEDEPIGLKKGSPAQILEHILKKKWSLDPSDKDMIVMWHKFNFKDGDKHRQVESSMVALGEDEVNTAMSKTVGLPLAIAAKMILQEKIKLSGVHVPIKKEIYEPVLAELTKSELTFVEREVPPTFY